MLAAIAMSIAHVSAALADEPSAQNAVTPPGNAKPAEDSVGSRDIAGQKRCEFFVTQKILSARDPRVSAHWDMDGKRVFEVSYRSTGVKGRVSRICVYDPLTRGALLPAVAEQDSWRP